MSRFIQFELWKDCSQGCPFCCNRGQVPINKNQSCQYVLDILDSLEPNVYDYIGLIGGEFFNGEMRFNMHSFFLIMRRIKELNPKKIFITTNLIYDMRDYLVPVLKAIGAVLGIRDKIVICTSWDYKYRFHTPEQQQLWFKNMLYLKDHFPEVELHVEMIMTQHLIDAVLNDTLDLNLFKQVLRCSLDFIEPSSGLYFHDKYECQKSVPGFFPTKSSFIKFLMKERNNIDLDKLFSMELRSEELYFIENGERRIAKNRRLGDGRCELKDKSKKYDIGFIDSDQSMRDVVNMFRETIG